MKDNQEIAKDYTDWHIKTGGFARDMTLRDYFAAEAMKAMIINVDNKKDMSALITESAYKWADAMLKERNK